MDSGSRGRGLPFFHLDHAPEAAHPRFYFLAVLLALEAGTLCVPYAIFHGFSEMFCYLRPDLLRDVDINFLIINKREDIL